MEKEANVSPFKLGHVLLVTFFRSDYFGVVVEAEYLILADTIGEEGVDPAITNARKKYEYDFKRTAAKFSVSVKTLHHQDAFNCLLARGPNYALDLS